MDYLYYIFGALTFLAVVLLIEGLYLVWNSAKGPEAERIARRLRVMSAGTHTGGQNTSMIKKRLLSESPSIQRALLKIPRIGVLDRFLEQSGLSWNVAEFAGLSVIAFFLALFGSSYLGAAWIIQLGLAGGAAALPYLYVTRSKSLRLIRIEQQLPDALDLIGRALRAGHAFPSALKMVGDEMNAPLADEFRIVFDEVNFGIAMQDALMNLATRVPSTDVRYFVIAVLIQRETGGNLSELLGSISTIIRDRLKLMGQIQVLSAEGRLSAWILSLLPFATAALIQLSNPEFLKVLYTDPFGRKMLGVAVLMMLLGILVMRKIIRIRV